MQKKTLSPFLLNGESVFFDIHDLSRRLHFAAWDDIEGLKSTVLLRPQEAAVLHRGADLREQTLAVLRQRALNDEPVRSVV